MNPKISVITPVYNGVSHIAGCLESVIHQGCAQAEHLLVDGASTDGTMKLINQYADKYAHIRYSTSSDAGQSDAMNKGIALSRGDIVGFLNVDDRYEFGVLNRILEIFGSLNSPALAVGNCNIWDENDNLIAVNIPGKLTFPNLLRGHALNPFPINPSAYFYHKSLHEVIGGYDVDENYVLDWDFILRAVQVAEVHYFNETWGNYYLLPGTKTYSDRVSGNNRERTKKLLKTFRRELPWHQSVWIGLESRVLDNPFAGTLRYFLQNPQELPWRAKKRLLHSLHLD
jgi:glycosyltransferase involved in cell wall biosynthesis